MGIHFAKLSSHPCELSTIISIGTSLLRKMLLSKILGQNESYIYLGTRSVSEWPHDSQR